MHKIYRICLFSNSLIPKQGLNCKYLSTQSRSADSFNLLYVTHPSRKLCFGSTESLLLKFNLCRGRFYFETLGHTQQSKSTRRALPTVSCNFDLNTNIFVFGVSVLCQLKPFARLV